MRKISLLTASPYRCLDHGNLSSLPCAWPGCGNGVAEDQFEEAERLEGLRPTIYSRRQWKSPLGGVYFGWESNELPNWFFIRETYWNEARRHKLVMDSFPETVYHYTTLAGLVGIVESKSIWLSDFSFLNDSRELIHGARLANTAIDHILDDESDLEAQRLLAALKKTLETLPNRICVASFSEDDDSLAQWRAYGPIAIGFNADSLALHVNQASLYRVEYNAATQRKLIDIYLHHLRQALLRDKEAGHLPELQDSYYHAEQLLEILAFFKDHAFHSESEVRLAYVDNPRVFTSLGFEPLPKSFRASRGRLIPYVSSLDVLRSDRRKYGIDITKLVLGPECDDLHERGIKEFLDAKGMAGVAVHRSAVPFRP